MATKSIKKILPADLKQKHASWSHAKNTINMVNCGIEKICEDSKNLLNSVKTRPENKGPLRSLKSYQHEKIPLSVNVPGTSRYDMANLTEFPNTGSVHHERSIEKSVIGQNSAAASLTTQRKIMKSSSNYKIYGSRRFGSSASSSRASLFRRYDNRHGTSQRKPHLSSLQRSLRIYKDSRTSNNYVLNGSVATYENFVQARNQHIMFRQAEDVPSDVLKMSVALRHELMPVNREVKDRIAVGQLHVKLPLTNLKCKDPLNEWRHPPHADLFSTRCKERGNANAELQEQHRKMQSATKIRQFEQLHRMERRSNIMDFVGPRATMQRIGAGSGGTEYDNVAKLITPRNSPNLAARALGRTNDIQGALKLMPPVHKFEIQQRLRKQQNPRAAADTTKLSMTDEMKTGNNNDTPPIAKTAGLTMIIKKTGDLSSTKPKNKNSAKTKLNKKKASEAITTTKSKFMPPQSQKKQEIDRAPIIYKNTSTLNKEIAAGQSMLSDKKIGEMSAPAPYNNRAIMNKVKSNYLGDQLENVEKIVRAPKICKKSPTARLLTEGGAVTQSMAFKQKTGGITRAPIVKAATITTKKSDYIPERTQTDKVEEIVCAPNTSKTSPTAVLVKGQNMPNNVRHTRSAYYIKNHWATKKM